jgi:antitoxin HicB
MSVASDYPVVIRPLSVEDGGGFAAYVPDLPGCMSDGNTSQEALANVVDAIECWFEAAQDMGRPIPPPSPAAPEQLKRYG